MAFVSPLTLLFELPVAATLLATNTSPVDFAADAAAIEKSINDDYAYLDRFPGGRMPMSDKLRTEAVAVDSKDELVRYAERALTVLADHHAITGSSLSDSWALVPSYSDLWVEKRGGDYVITAVREGSPAKRAGILVGDNLLAVDNKPTPAAVTAFWADLGVAGGGERDAFAARILAAGRRNAERPLTVGSRLGPDRKLSLPSLYFTAAPDRPVLTRTAERGSLVVHFNDSLGQDDTISAFDLAMEQAKTGQPVILDLGHPERW